MGHPPQFENTFLVETDLFNHVTVHEHFINDCCFGEDFAAWLKAEMRKRAEASTFSDIIQEDYGWGFWIRNRRDSFWVAISFVGDGAQTGPTAQWVISITPDYGLNIFKRLFQKPDQHALATFRNQMAEILQSNEALKIISP